MDDGSGSSVDLWSHTYPMAKYQLSKKIKIDSKGVTSKSSSIQSNGQIQTTLPPTLNSSIEPWSRAFNNSSQGLEIQDIAKVFFDRVLDVVKSILGRPDLQLIDLLDLPVVDDSFRFWGVYLSVIVENDTDNVEGVYVGSSLGYKGYHEISGRVAMHKRFSARTYDDLPRDVKSYHYSRACKDNVIPNFRTVSIFEIIRGNTVATIVAEQVLMVYLSTVAWAYQNQLHLFHESRRGIQDLPDFTHIGLNRALPLAQNQHWLPCNKTLHQEWLKETDQEDTASTVVAHLRVCLMKGDGRAFLKPDVALLVGFTDISTERRSTQISLLMQGCTRSSRGMRKPGLLRTSIPANAIFLTLWGPDMRCPGCYLHLRTPGAENNNPKYKKTAQKWVEEGHGDV
ncbi:hypothetical protein FOTG_00323 [Fusarium oxysporum f. sp. vasinfectum 25433]|uniref:Uncharacterized protein n=1 Tax=Fusarium oxysporum f. sp. vasinfectum 25433 TaxID=1089449 RepID=X0MCV3_FUSOX|nr:hypothetical protein FOTG_00323 [Fusarium oxysporum f. sp. vasinfectum 25433]